MNPPNTLPVHAEDARDANDIKWSDVDPRLGQTVALNRAIAKLARSSARLGATLRRMDAKR